MIWKTLGLLMAFLSPAALAGGGVQPAPVQPAPETAWLGHEVRLQNTSFCKRYGCIQTAVRQNTPNTMGGQDGQNTTYTLKSGAKLELSVRAVDRPPGQGRWISNAWLSLPRRGKVPNSDELRLAAEFYGTFTGRPFRAEAVSACLRRSLDDPDLEGGNALLSNWTTPSGLPYRARCNARTGMFWLGWMQQ